MKTNKKTFMDDHYIRGLLGIAALVVVGALLTVIFAITSGVLNLDATVPRTIDEYSVAKALASIELDNSAASWGQLAITQMDNGQFAEATLTIQQGREYNFEDEERNFYFDYAEARMLQIRGDLEGAREAYKRTMELILAAYETAMSSNMSPNWAVAQGLHQNYYDSAYALAFIYGEEDNYEKQLEFYDIFLKGNPTAGDVLVNRGYVKLKLGDKEGAIEDFMEALVYLPDDELALRGLKEAEGN